MSARRVRGKNGKRRWYRVALGAGQALPYSEIVEQMGERINRAQAEVEEWARGDPTIDAQAELEQVPVVKLNELADAFECFPGTFRLELKKLGIKPAFAACELHAGKKRCDCKRPRLLRVFEVTLLLVYGRDIYYRMVQRPGRVTVVKPGEPK